MTKTQNMIKNGPKVRVVLTLPALGEVEIGELIYEATNNRLYTRVVSGWKYVSFT